MSVETSFMLRNIFRGICTHSGGMALVVGTIGVLAGVEHLLSSRPKGQKLQRRAARPLAGAATRVAPIRVAATRVDYFQIRRTKSELGYTYWVLQGFGAFQSFTLHDTWREAVDDAMARIATFESTRSNTHEEILTAVSVIA